MLGTILLVVLILMLLGAIPTWPHSREWGYYPSGGLIQVVVVLVVVGVILWLINRFIPMARSIKSILNAVVIIAVVLWLLNVFGISTYLSTIRVGR